MYGIRFRKEVFIDMAYSQIMQRLKEKDKNSTEMVKDIYHMEKMNEQNKRADVYS